MQKKITIITLLLAITFTSACSQYNQPENKTTEQLDKQTPKTEQSSEKPPKTDSTSTNDLKSYTNKKYSYQFEYHPSFTIKEDNSYATVLVYTPAALTIEAIEPLPIAAINMYPNPKDQSPEEYLKENYEKWLGTPSKYEDFFLNEPIEFKGLEAREFATERDEYIMFNYKNSIYTIMSNDPTILDTFRLIDDKSQESTNILLIQRDTDASNGVSPDTIFVVDALKNTTPLARITASQYGFEGQLVKDKIYFIDTQRNDRKSTWMVKYYDFDGNIHPLEFTKTTAEEIENTFAYYYLVSEDGKKIAWAETNISYEAQQITDQTILKVANTDGTDMQTIIQRELSEARSLKPFLFRQTNQELYFSYEPEGIGGYIIFSGPRNLSKIDIQTRNIEQIADPEGKIKNLDYVTDISSDNKSIVYFRQRDDNPQVVVHNLQSGTEQSFPIPINEKFIGGGEAYFSPNNTHIAYNIAHWTPEDEYFRTILADLQSSKHTTIVDDPKTFYAVDKWLTHNLILLSTPNGEKYTVKMDGSDLKKIKAN